jgi:flagellar hook assembly protein FlgD
MRRLGLLFVALVIAGSASAQLVVRASYTASNSTTNLQWAAVPGAATYHVRRTYTFPTNWSTFTGITGTSFGEFFNGADNVVVYQVLAMNASGVQVGPPSNYAWVTKYSYSWPTITAGSTTITPVHVNALRTVLTSMRATMGLAAPTWTQPTLNPGTTIIEDADVEDLRTALNAMTGLLGLGTPPYTQTSPLAGKLVLKADVQQLHDIIRSYPEMYWPFPAALDPYFSPNGDGVKDTTTFSSNVSWNSGSTRTDFRWQIYVRNSANVLLRTDAGTSPVLRIGNDNPRVIHTWIWDGRDAGGAIQPDGVYSYEIVDLDTIGGPIPGGWGKTTVTIDTVAPTATITAPTDPYTLSNVRLNGGGSVTVTGTASDAVSLADWKLERTGNSQGTAQLGTGTTTMTNATLGTVSTISNNAPTLSNGDYQLVLTVTDKAGNTTVENNALTVAHFVATQTVYQINAVNNQTVTYTSSVPFTLTEAVEIKDAANNVVRTLFSGSRAPGNHIDVWDGKNNGGQVVGDGPYYMTAAITDGASSFTWDPRSSYVGGQGVTQFEYPQCRSAAGSWVACGDSAAIDFDPFKLKPLTMSYCVGSGGVTNCTASAMPAWVIAKVTNTGETDATCSPACVFTEYQPGGLQQHSWYGTSVAGSYVAPYYNRLTVIRRYDQIPRNFVYVYGTTPSISNPRITPFIYNPGAGTAANGQQTFTVAVDTYAGRQAQLKLQFRNMSSNSTLRTLVTGFGPEGDLSATWDGRADNNAFVAPAWYEVTITAIDSAGSATKIKPIVVVRY